MPYSLFSLVNINQAEEVSRVYLYGVQSVDWIGLDLTQPGYFAKESQEREIIIGTVLWNLWLQQNSIAFNTPLEDQRLVIKSKHLLVLSAKALEKPRGSPLQGQNGSRGPSCWSPPMISLYKLNTDGAGRASDGMASCGGSCATIMLIRDLEHGRSCPTLLSQIAAWLNRDWSVESQHVMHSGNKVADQLGNEASSSNFEIHLLHTPLDTIMGLIKEDAITYKWHGSVASVNVFVWFPAAASLQPRPMGRPISGSWSAPDAGCLKFNVDAAVKWSFGEAGISGILRDHCGKALIRFSKSIGMSDPIGAELVAIHEACQIGDTDRAVRFLRLMEERGFKPDVVASGTVIDCLCKNGLLNEALDLFSELKRVDAACKLLGKMLASGLVSSQVTCLILLDGLCKNGKLKEALKIFQVMRNSGLELDIIFYTILIDGLCKSGQIEGAKELFHELSVKGLKPDIYTYTIMINEFCKVGLPDEAY
ncbi:hypothetical protein V6N12_010687 [Hibiscus sabdariffa]|uniref:Pentatricopeptide repeat-containing protein n=1 Tax=Hibiscus sabdariffa TaxID=183260 RepID=A0ABR2EKU9_9ROSI